MKETSFDQDTRLLNDIIKRNYYDKLKNGQKIFEIVLDTSIGSCAQCAAGCNNRCCNSSMIMVDNYTTLLRLYTKEQLTAPIQITGNFLAYKNWAEILQLTLEYFSNIKPRGLYITLLASNLTEDSILTLANIIEKSDIMLSFIVKLDTLPSQVSDSVYKFIQKYRGSIQAQITPQTAGEWVMEYNWLQQNTPSILYNNIELVEQSSEKWSTESLEEMLVFYNYYMNAKLAQFNNDKKKFLTWMLGCGEIIVGGTCNLTGLHNQGIFRQSDKLPCRISDKLSIKLSTLELLMCSEVDEDLFIIGKLKEDKFEQNNVAIQVLKDHIKQSALPHCELCNYCGICDKFCLKQSFIDSNNLLIPLYQTCKLKQMKYSFIILKLLTEGIFEFLSDIKMDKQFKTYITYLIDNLSQKREGVTDVQ